MTNQNVIILMCNQFGWDHRDVKAELILVAGHEYEFVVIHDPEYHGKYAKKVVKISVVDLE